jgi:replication-associated recombination protein RarA
MCYMVQKTKAMRNIEGRGWFIMATCSITDAFVVDANDYYRALDAAMKAAEEAKKRPVPPKVEAAQLKGAELKHFMEKLNV